MDRQTNRLVGLGAIAVLDPRLDSPYFVISCNCPSKKGATVKRDYCILPLDVSDYLNNRPCSI